MPDDHFKIISTKATRKAGIFNYDVVWEIKVDIPLTQTESLADQIASRFFDLPNEGDLYPGNPLATCREVSAESTSKGGVYQYAAKYSTEGNRSNSGGSSGSGGTQVAVDKNPLFDLPRLRWIGSLENVAIHKDRDDEGILNKAGDPIIETKDDNRIGASITVNVASVPPNLLSFRNTCNEAEIVVGGLPVAAEAARVVFPSSFLSEQKTRNDVDYFELSYDLLFDAQDLHYGKPLNAGFRELVSGELKTIIGDDGSEITEPHPLTAAGLKLDAPTPSTVNYIDVKKYPTADYSDLPGMDRL